MDSALIRSNQALDRRNADLIKLFTSRGLSASERSDLGDVKRASRLRLKHLGRADRNNEGMMLLSS